MVDQEQWRPVPGYELYEVSDRGRIVSHHRKSTRVLRPRLGATGYLLVTLCADGTKATRTVHSVVAETFLGPRPADLQVRHLDGDKSHNWLTNLQYGTASENMRDLVMHGGHGNASKDECPAGHAYTAQNTRRTHGRRYCRACQRDAATLRRNAAALAAANVSDRAA